MQAVRSVLESFRLNKLSTRLYWADSHWVILDDEEGDPWLYVRQPSEKPPNIHGAKYILQRCGFAIARYGWRMKDNTWSVPLRRLDGAKDDGH